MTRFRIVLVEPKSEGNVGAVARLMANFGTEDLTLVGSAPLGDEARKRAMHGATILDSARFCDSLKQALEGVDLVVGTSGIATASEKRFARIAIAPKEFATRVAHMDQTIALMFGREDFGLSNEELQRCDLLVTIPASPAYPILNLSHAVAILLYELRIAGQKTRRDRRASGVAKERLHQALSDLMAATQYPVHKRARTQIMFRRLIGRAVPSAWEFHALMGVFQRATKRIRRLEGKR